MEHSYVVQNFIQRKIIYGDIKKKVCQVQTITEQDSI